MASAHPPGHIRTGTARHWLAFGTEAMTAIGSWRPLKLLARERAHGTREKGHELLGEKRNNQVLSFHLLDYNEDASFHTQGRG